MRRQRASAALLVLLLSAARPCSAALELRLEAASIDHPQLADPLRAVSVGCRLEVQAQRVLRCEGGRAAARWRDQVLQAGFGAGLSERGAWDFRLDHLRAPALSLEGHFSGDFSGAAERLQAKLAAQVSDLSRWPALIAALAPSLPRLDLSGTANLQLRLDRMGDAGSAEANLDLTRASLSEPSGRYASEQLDLRLDATARWDPRRADFDLQARSARGQAYAEPVFLDLGQAPLQASAKLHLDRPQRRLQVQDLQFDQSGVGRLDGALTWAPGTPVDADLKLSALQLGPAFERYLQPFAAGTRFEKLGLSGEAHGELSIRGSRAASAELVLRRAGIEAPAFDAALDGLEGRLSWAAADAGGPAKPSTLSWSGGRIARLELGGSALRFVARARDFELQASLRLPLAGGALRVNELVLRELGRPEVSARFDAEIEPIDLAALTRALGWPVFGGTLSGRLPGLQLQDRELRLDGTLRARAFDGEIAVDGLRAIDPLGRVPRVLASIHLRGLDLAQLTGAFSFGRIEGRLDGDVDGLRLVNWQPVAFDAWLGTPAGDRSRKRISQRAIDNISSIGGGPTGVLSRGVMRFFEDFAYARIGWRCVLRDGVCHMDGLAPAKDGGYVLVQGRLLPRIDVVGFQREVDWNTFLSQLKSASAAQAVEVR